MCSIRFGIWMFRCSRFWFVLCCLILLSWMKCRGWVLVVWLVGSGVRWSRWKCFGVSLV